MKRLGQILLSPFALLYGIVVFIRNKCYDFQVFKTKKISQPILIGVGNLSVGGTGKTPHVEYIINRLQVEFNCGILSRGYGRNSSGFVIADSRSDAVNIGDEPLQYKSKFKDIVVAVDEKRVRGIENLSELHPELDVVVLDDVFQHRAIQPHLNLLVTDYNNLYTSDCLLPSGRLREWRCGSKRADIIIVSKCPNEIGEDVKNTITQELNPLPHQQIYFSHIRYGSLTPFTEDANKRDQSLNGRNSILLVTGIANANPLLHHLNGLYKDVKHIKFADHHDFKVDDLKKIRSAYEGLKNENKIIISTEKDIMRLSLPTLKKEINDLPFFFLPIEVHLEANGNSTLDKEILDYVRENK